jgi:ParB-like chromosome segregation protein Spo0J
MQLNGNNPADSVERWDIDSLVPYARNARLHSDHQVAQIAASMREWGWTIPVLVDEHGGIIAGHGRVMAARKLGYLEVPCMIARGWSEEKKRAYVIADNKLTLNGAWDNDLLKYELEELGEWRELVGFNDAEFAALIAPEHDVDLKDEWANMPDFEQDNIKSFRKIIVHFHDQAAVDAFAKAIGQSFTPSTRFTWYPQEERAVAHDQEWTSTGGRDRQPAQNKRRQHERSV